jgi:hypothetical protein
MRELILKTIYWGYIRGMRGNHFINILKNFSKIEDIFSEVKNEKLKTKDFIILKKRISKVPGLGLSTYSKLLYFNGVKFNNNPCLILDQRLIDVFSQKVFEEFSKLAGINNYNAENKYLDYLEISNDISSVLNTQGENVEQFLFIFGTNLKQS